MSGEAFLDPEAATAAEGAAPCWAAHPASDESSLTKAIQGALDSEAPALSVPLLKASLPMPAGQDQYKVIMQRASLMQPYGIPLCANVTGYERINKIVAEGDLPHLGIHRWDELVSINCTRPRSLSACFEILAQAMSVVLLFQRPQATKEPAPLGTLPNLGSCLDIPHLAEYDAAGQHELRTLLALTGPTVTDACEGEFQLTLWRAYREQRFGVSFATETVHWKTRVLVGEDAPQLGLCQGDHLVLINGALPQVEVACQKILKKKRTVTLVLRRPPGALASLAAQVQPILEDPWQLEEADIINLCALGGVIPLDARAGDGLQAETADELVIGFDALGGPLLDQPTLSCIPDQPTLSCMPCSVTTPAACRVAFSAPVLPQRDAADEVHGAVLAPLQVANEDTYSL